MNETPNQEEITKQMQKLLHERGKEALELARKTEQAIIWFNLNIRKLK
jgi:hypothetical protein